MYQPPSGPFAGIENQVPIRAASKKRRASDGSAPALMSAHNKHHDEHQQQTRALVEEARFWKEKYLELQKVRVTQAESQLFLLAEESRKRETSLKNYILHLEEQKRPTPEEMEELERLRVKATQREHELRLYETLTSCTLSDVMPDENVACSCSVTNPDTKDCTKFRLSAGDGKNVVKYEPLENASLLPWFLRTPIEFESNQCPSLLQNVLGSLYAEEGEE